ncbi:MAG TPA: T9SS type A sorting domain-containing protein, partial [Saprospiraceae bacterium]|nr:T9SS type A sorting domain-containing protein [Saprospiraceae bacterium]
FYSILVNVTTFSQINLLTNQLDSDWPGTIENANEEGQLSDLSNLSSLICNPNSFWAYGNTSIEEYTINGNAIIKTGVSLDKGNTVSGIAFCNNLDGNAFSPTMYSADLTKPEYFDGTVWKSSTVSVPEFILNPGGYGDYLYYVFYNQLTGSKEILRYTGTELKSIYHYPEGVIPTIADLAVDENGNLWTFSGLNDNKLHTDSLSEISPSGQLLHQYAFSFNSIHAYGCFILNKVIYIGLGTDNPDYPNSLVPITIENGLVKTGIAIPFSGEYSDLAACNAGNPLALNDIEEKSLFTIFPNPSKDYINIKATENYTGNTELSISNLYGQKFIERHYDYLNPIEGSRINLAGLQNGVYILIITTGSHQSSFKIIKQE